MKYFGVLFLFLTLQLSAQEAFPENWFADLELATTHADSNDNAILMVFAGSDWCRPCIQLKKDILMSSDFKNFADDQLTVLYLDFPARRKNQLPAEQKQHNEALAEKYNSSGAFPQLVLMTKDGEVLAQPAFKGQSPTDFVEEINATIQ